jgi:hypothetical protein
MNERAKSQRSEELFRQALRLYQEMDAVMKQLAQTLKIAEGDLYPRDLTSIPDWENCGFPPITLQMLLQSREERKAQEAAAERFIPDLPELQPGPGDPMDPAAVADDAQPADPYDPYLEILEVLDVCADRGGDLLPEWKALFASRRWGRFLHDLRSVAGRQFARASFERFCARRAGDQGGPDPDPGKDQ